MYFVPVNCLGVTPQGTRPGPPVDIEAEIAITQIQTIPFQVDYEDY